MNCFMLYSKRTIASYAPRVPSLDFNVFCDVRSQHEYYDHLRVIIPLLQLHSLRNLSLFDWALIVLRNLDVFFGTAVAR